jgi:cytoskeletal protein CcmA (bactofilin family)
MMKKAKENSNASQTSNRILSGTSLEGEVKSDGDFRVDGSIDGTIEISGKLVVGEQGKVKGEVKCGSANISGRLEGTLHVEELLSLEESAHLHGDVYTGKISILPGAEFTGSCNMGAVVRQMEKNEQNGASPAKAQSAQG